MVTFLPKPSTDGFVERGEQNTPETLDHVLASGIVAIDADERIVGFNSVAESFLGLAASDVLGCPAEVLPAALRDALRETLLNGEPISERQIGVPVGPLSALTLRLTTIATRAAEGRPAGAIGVLGDLNPNGGFHHKLRQMARLAHLGTLSVGMAHEIKNALVAVRTFVDLLINQSPEAKFADVVSREIRRIDTLVSQMLRFSGPDRRNYSEVSVHEVLQQSLELLQRELPERQIVLHCSLQARSDQILGDPCQLEQSFLNLLFNALDAMGPNGNLTVATRIVPVDVGQERQTPFLEVSISDTGAGIPPGIQDRLFEPFFTTKANGSGLGLAITRRIVEEHGGSIRAESQPSRGTTFFLHLPLARSV